MDKLLLIGSDFGAIDVVQAAHKRGIYVIVCDYLESTPAKELADEKWLISTTEIDIIVEKARNAGVSGVMCAASDFNGRNVRKICKKMNLPMYCPDDDVWEISVDKSKFKRMCHEVGAPVATDYYLSHELREEEIQSVKYPVVVKPIDMSANRGISYCSNRDELIKGYRYAESLTRKDTIIVERQLHGEEFYVGYLLAEGTARLLTFVEEHHIEGYPGNLYSMQNTTSHQFTHYLEDANEKVAEVFKHAGFRDGIAWVETMLDDDGHFYLLEMGHRFGGDMNYSLYAKLAGVNAVDWMIDCALGEKHKVSQLHNEIRKPFKETVGAYHLFSSHEAVVGQIEGLSMIESWTDVQIDMCRKSGQKVNKFFCMGVIRIYSKSIEDLEAAVHKINKVLRITDDKGENLLVKFEDFTKIKLDYRKNLEDFS